MNSFNINLNISLNDDPLGFEYGPDCFGPIPEIRKLNDIRKSLLDPNSEGPEHLYAIAMNVGKKEHRKQIENQHLCYCLVSLAKGQLGNEPVRSQGHIHVRSAYGKNWSTPEVYQIVAGKAVIYMQEFADDQPGNCYAVYAEPGDIVIVPPFWAHATISANPKQALTFAAWCDMDFGYEYDKVRAHKGLAWYPILNGSGELAWEENHNYVQSELIRKKPNDYNEFNLIQKECMYTQYEKNPDLFLFVAKPYLKTKDWKTFIP